MSGTETRSDLEAMILTVVVEQVAELLGIDPELVDPRYIAPQIAFGKQRATADLDKVKAFWG